MGGPCYLVEEPPTNPPAGGGQVASAPAVAPRKRIIGPPCTDNFQVALFPFDGDDWQSVEQCYQACKVLKTSGASFRQRLQQMLPFAGETDHSYGMRVWREGSADARRAASSAADDAARAATDRSRHWPLRSWTLPCRSLPTSPARESERWRARKTRAGELMSTLPDFTLFRLQPQRRIRSHMYDRERLFVSK